MAKHMHTAKARRHSIRTAFAAAAVMAVLGAGVSFTAAGCSPATPSASESAPAESAKAGSAQATKDDAKSGKPAPSATPSPSPTPDLTWRDADFAVDPARTTWNSEPSATKTVYLTFDDGPSQNTERVLDILDKYDAKATFFVTGLMPQYAPWIKEAYKRGHTIGLHTYSHDYAQVYSSTAAFYADLDAIGNLVKEQIGYVPAFIRFPGGSSNTISASYTRGIMSALAPDVQARGYQYYDWTGSCGDGAVHPADVLFQEATKWGDQQNIILLMHDSAPKDSTVEALPRVIEYYKNAGYEFKAIDRDTMVPHHGIGN